MSKLLTAILEVQKELKTLQKDGANSYFKDQQGNPSQYITLNSVLDEVIPRLNSKGVLVIQPIIGNSVVTKLIYAETGETIESSCDLHYDGKNLMQAKGAAITYSRRFSLVSLLGMRAEDKDGNDTTDGGEFGKFNRSHVTISKGNNNGNDL